MKVGAVLITHCGYEWKREENEDAARTGQIYGGTGMTNLPHMHTMVSPLNELNVVDYGDINVDQLSLERSLGHIREMVRQVAATGTIR